MSRRIVTVATQAAGSAVVDGYFDRVLKYIPADINGAWVAATGLINSAGNDVPKNTVFWICFVAGVVATPIWTFFQTKGSGAQAVVSTIAFIVWVFALDGTWIKDTLPWYLDLYGSLLLIGYTLAVGAFDPKQAPITPPIKPIGG